MNDQENSLIRRTSIMANESLPSLLKRLAELNCYNPYGMFTQLIKERSCNKDKIEFPYQAETYREIAELTGIPILEIYTSSAHYFAEVLTPPDSAINYLNINEHTFLLLSQAYAAKQLRPLYASQFCPKCLNKSAYHRLIWAPIAVSACLEHNCLLINHCPTCQSNVTIQSIVEAQCSNCSADLSLAESTTLYDDEWGLFSQHLIQTWLIQEALPISVDTLLPTETSRILYRVVDGLQWATRMLVGTDWSYQHYVKSNPLDPKQHQKDMMRNITPQESYHLYATACKGIIRWPHGLWDFLRAYRAHMRAIRSTNGGPKADLGNLYTQWIQEYWQHPAFEFVHNAFKDFFIRTYSLSSAVIRTDFCRKNAEIVEEILYVSVAKAARLLEVTPKTVNLLLQKGELTCRADQASKQRYRFLNREEVLILRDKWNEAVGCAEAARYLGITKKMLLDLVEVGLLAAEKSPTEGGYPRWMFSKWSLVNCVQQISRYVEAFPEEGKRIVSLVDLIAASQSLSVIGMNAASVLARVAEGMLNAYYSTNRCLELRSLQFDYADIQQCINAIKLENGWMSREEVIQLLRVKDSTLARWVRSGVVPTTAIFGNAQYFNQEIITSFVTDYITTEEAAKILGVGKLAVQKWVRQGRLSQVCISGPYIDGHHAYLFNKDKLIQWRSERLTFSEAVQLLGISKATLHRWIIEDKIKPLNDMGGKQRWFSRKAIFVVYQKLSKQVAKKI